MIFIHQLLLYYHDKKLACSSQRERVILGTPYLNADDQFNFGFISEDYMLEHAESFI